MAGGRGFPGGGEGPVQNSSNDDGVTMLRTIAQNISQLVASFAGLIATAGTVGQVTLAAAASTVVSNITVEAGSMVILTPANAAAGTLVSGAQSPYVSLADHVAGVSFTIKTASGVAAAGTEIFTYQIVNII